MIFVCFGLASTGVGNSLNEKYTKDAVQFLQKVVQDQVLVQAIVAQNSQHEHLSQSEVDELDMRWRAETNVSARPMISSVMNNDVSKYLRRIKSQNEGVLTEIFVMDNRGFNVGTSDITSDYFQGDEDKWQKTFQKGKDAVFESEVEFDESTQVYQIQISMTIVDGNGMPIGAICAGFDAEKMDQIQKI